MRQIVIFVFIYLSVAHVIALDKTKRIIDNNAPINITLPVGKEVELVFDKRIQSIGINQALSSKLEVQSIDYRAWLLAQESFVPEKVLIKNEKGEIKVLVLSALEGGQTIEKYKIVSERPKKKDVIDNIAVNDVSSEYANYSYIDFTRFAAQQLYAPKRLITQNTDIVRVPISTDPIDLFICTSNLACTTVLSVPMVSWRSLQYNVTAVKLINQSSQIIDLDPRDIKGEFVAATFQFNRLGVSGSSTDTSVVYLVSKYPFEQAL